MCFQAVEGVTTVGLPVGHPEVLRDVNQISFNQLCISIVYGYEMAHSGTIRTYAAPVVHSSTYMSG